MPPGPGQWLSGQEEREELGNGVKVPTWRLARERMCAESYMQVQAREDGNPFKNQVRETGRREGENRQQSIIKSSHLTLALIFSDFSKIVNTMIQVSLLFPHSFFLP